jgi:glycosyltransferase involved in cell wall biosynthesis
MIVCFLANADSVNAISWAEHFSNQLGHEVHIITLHEYREKLNDISVHRAYGKCGGKKILYPFSIPRIRRIIQSIKPDVLIGYRLTSYGFIAACTGFRPLVLAADGGDVQVEAKKSPIMKTLVRYALSKADLVHAWSQNIKDSLSDLDVKDESIFFLPRGIELDLFKPLKESERKSLSIITTRSLTNYCKIEIILTAIAQIKQQYPDIEYLVVGDGPQEKFLENLVKDLEISANVRLLGRLERCKIPTLLAQSAIYCSMLESDGLSASLLEAMAAGAFPVVSSIPANRYWIDDGVNGLLVEPNAVEQLSQSIVQALSDRDLRNKAQAINQNIVEKEANIATNMQVFEKKYVELVSKA